MNQDFVCYYSCLHGTKLTWSNPFSSSDLFQHVKNLNLKSADINNGYLSKRICMAVIECWKLYIERWGRICHSWIWPGYYCHLGCYLIDSIIFLVELRVAWAGICPLAGSSRYWGRLHHCYFLDQEGYQFYYCTSPDSWYCSLIAMVLAPLL